MQHAFAYKYLFKILNMKNNLMIYSHQNMHFEISITVIFSNSKNFYFLKTNFFMNYSKYYNTVFKGLNKCLNN